MSFQYLKEILFLIGSDKKKLPLMVCLFLVLSVLDLAGIGLVAPYVTIIADPDYFLQSTFYGGYQKLGLSSEIRDILFNIGLALVIVFTVKAGIAMFINFVLLKFCHGQSVALRASLMRSYQNLPYVDYIEKNSSQLIHNINLADKFATGTLLAMLRIICDGLVLISIILFLSFADIKAFALLTVILIVFAISYDRILRARVKFYGEESNASSIKVLKSVQEALIGLKEIRVLKKEEFFFNSMYESAVKFASVSVKAALANLSPRFLLELIMVSFVVLLVLMSLVEGRSMSELLPLLSMYGVAAIKLAPAATSIISGISKMRFYRDAVALVYNDVSRISDSKIANAPKSDEEASKFTSICLHNLHFEYPGSRSPAIRDLSLQINNSDIIGFVGASGSGKTTLVDVILGLLKPQKGEIYHNNRLLNDESIGEWRSRVAYLPQDVFLLDDTLERNIALGVHDKDVNQKKLQEAIAKARLTQMVSNLSKGLDTLVGERGMKLSGGQKQRIALARAFYHERDILVMDESTSALDTETEQEIVDEIQRLKGEKTMIVIAHRITTLQHCNAIYRLDGGRLSEKLTYAELAD